MDRTWTWTLDARRSLDRSSLAHCQLTTHNAQTYNLLPTATDLDTWTHHDGLRHSPGRPQGHMQQNPVIPPLSSSSHDDSSADAINRHQIMSDISTHQTQEPTDADHDGGGRRRWSIPPWRSHQEGLRGHFVIFIDDNNITNRRPPNLSQNNLRCTLPSGCRCRGSWHFHF